MFLVMMSGWSVLTFPLSFKISDDYPFNSFKGIICSGQGLDQATATKKQISSHLSLFAAMFLYGFAVGYFSLKTSRLMKRLCPNGTFGQINGKFRLFISFYEKSKINLFRRNFITFSDTTNVMVDFLLLFWFIILVWRSY